MGYLNKFRKSQSLQKPDGWISLETIKQLDSIAVNSLDKPVVIFKHSTSCGISLSVIDKFSQQWESFDPENTIYYLDLLAFRSVSNAIAEKFDVIHQSPQILVIKNGKSIYEASHHAIDLSKFNELVTDNLDQ